MELKHSFFPVWENSSGIQLFTTFILALPLLTLVPRFWYAKSKSAMEVASGLHPGFVEGNSCIRCFCDNQEVCWLSLIDFR